MGFFIFIKCEINKFADENITTSYVTISRVLGKLDQCIM